MHTYKRHTLMHTSIIFNGRIYSRLKLSNNLLSGALSVPRQLCVSCCSLETNLFVAKLDLIHRFITHIHIHPVFIYQYFHTYSKPIQCINCYQKSDLTTKSSETRLFLLTAIHPFVCLSVSVVMKLSNACIHFN